MVRPPGFGPGSTAWKADVLDQTRLRSRRLGPRSFEGNIFSVSVNLKVPRKADSTIDSSALKPNSCNVRVNGLTWKKPK